MKWFEKNAEEQCEFILDDLTAKIMLSLDAADVNVSRDDVNIDVYSDDDAADDLISKFDAFNRNMTGRLTVLESDIHKKQISRGGINIACRALSNYINKFQDEVIFNFDSSYIGRLDLMVEDSDELDVTSEIEHIAEDYCKTKSKKSVQLKLINIKTYAGGKNRLRVRLYLKMKIDSNNTQQNIKNRYEF